MKKSSIFLKHAESGNVDEANLYSSCCLKHGYFKPIYPTKMSQFIYGQLILVSVQRTAQKSC